MRGCQYSRAPSWLKAQLCSTCWLLSIESRQTRLSGAFMQDNFEHVCLGKPLETGVVRFNRADVAKDMGTKF